MRSGAALLPLVRVCLCLSLCTRFPPLTRDDASFPLLSSASCASSLSLSLTHVAAHAPALVTASLFLCRSLCCSTLVLVEVSEAGDVVSFLSLSPSRVQDRSCSQGAGGRQGTWCGSFC